LVKSNAPVIRNGKVRKFPCIIRNSKETNTVELKYTDKDGAVDKTKLNVYKDGNDEEFLKLIEDFKITSILKKYGKINMLLILFIKISKDALLEQLETCGIK
jgi:hypothetical protein